MTGAVARYSRLYWKMVRFKVAVMLLMFLLLGAAHHDGREELRQIPKS